MGVGVWESNKSNQPNNLRKVNSVISKQIPSLFHEEKVQMY